MPCNEFYKSCMVNLSEPIRTGSKDRNDKWMRRCECGRTIYSGDEK